MGVVEIKKSVKEIIPVKRKNNVCRTNPNGYVTVTLLINNPLMKLACKLLNAPDKFDIDLDEFNTFIWRMIDGKKSVHKICLEGKNRFGKTAGPVYERTISFIKQLERNKIIKL